MSVRAFRRLALAVMLGLMPAAEAVAQCALTGNPAAIATLGDRQILPGNDEVIVHRAANGTALVSGVAPKGAESSPQVPGGRRVPGGRDVLRYTNRVAPQGQVQEMHVIGAGIAPARAIVGGSAKPVVLVIVSNGEMMRWKLFVLPGTRLAKVVLQGLKADIEGIPAGTEIVRREPCELHTTGRASGTQPLEAELSPSRIQRVLADIRAFTGLVEATFQHGLAPDTLATGARVSALPALAMLRPDEMARATDARILDYMDAARQRLPDPARPAVSLLMDLVRTGRIPAATFDEHGERLPLLWFSPETPVSGANPTCTSNVLIELGTTRSLTCDGGARIYVGDGPGRTMLRDAAGSSILAPGKGTSFIAAGSGRDLVILERGWGIASISKTCGIAASRLRGRRPPLGMIHTGFVLLGPGVRPGQLAWYPTMRRASLAAEIAGLTLAMRLAALRSPSSRILIDRKSRSIVVLRQTCFNLLFAEDGRITPPMMPR